MSALAIAVYASGWGWLTAAAVVLLLLIHEAGHVVQLRRERLPTAARDLAPFLGAYEARERTRPLEQQARIAVAGPIAGTAAASVIYLLAGDDEVLRSIAFAGFFLNLFALVPVGILDGHGLGGLFTSGWWAIIAALLAPVALVSGSAFAGFLAAAAALSAVVHRRGGFALDPRDGVPIEQRINAATFYVAVSTVCAFGMAATFVDGRTMVF